jgi:hypothetical protein
LEGLYDVCLLIHLLTFKRAINDDSIFQMPDLILKIGPRKLFLKKDDFKQISKVFEAMLINDFKEKNRSEIEFKGKDYKTFVHFLRVSLVLCLFLIYCIFSCLLGFFLLLAILFVSVLCLCVRIVASVSGLPILDCHFGVL